MATKKPKTVVRDNKGRQTSIGKGVREMKFGETRTFNISIDIPAEKPPKKEK